MKLIFYGKPKAIQSFRFTRQGRKYQPKDVVNWKNWVASTAKKQLGNHKPFTGAVRIKRALFVFPPVSSLKADDKRYIASGGYILKTTKPDLTDNLFKGLIDALAGVVYDKDQQICHNCESYKVMGKEPRIEIEFEEINCLRIDKIE